MKSKKRHELQTNILADWLGRHIQQWKPYANLLFVGVVIVCAGVWGARYYLVRQSTQANSGWESYFSAINQRDPERLAAVAAEYSSTEVALWAKQSEGDLELALGNDSIYRDRDAANKALVRARDCFEEVMDGTSKFPELQQQAKLGLAKALESLGALHAYEDSGDLKEAADLYASVAESAPGTALEEFATKRAELLRTSSVDQWYNWFSRQQPAPPASSNLNTGVPGEPGLPQPMTNLPDMPDFSTSGDNTPDVPDTPDMPAGEDADPETTPVEPKPAPAAAESAPDSAEPDATPGTAKPAMNAPEASSAEPAATPPAEPPNQ